MKTLVVSPFSPYPLVFGGAIRLYHLIKMFASFSDVTLLSYVSWADDEDPARHLQTICEKVVMVDAIPLRHRRKALIQAQATLSPRSFQYHSHFSRAMQQAIDAELAATQFDTIVVELSQMGYFSYQQPGALRILDLQNIEHELILRRAQVEPRPAKRLALQLEGRKFRREEIAICRDFDLVFTPSGRERDQLQPLLTPVPVECLPNSIDADQLAPRATVPTDNHIVFVGSTHVDANRDGVQYFMERIFPLIEPEVPDVRFSIVGGDPPPEIREYGRRPNVEVTGYVKSIRPYMERARGLVVPLRSGGGTRLKILEALSLGVPTVSTSVGAEGLSIADGTHLLLGDTPEAFARQVVRLLQDEALQRRLGVAGRRLVEESYSWQAVGRLLQNYLAAARARRRAASSPAGYVQPRHIRPGEATTQASHDK
jgi:polysaccharide biosynthesis protein PslH